MMLPLILAIAAITFLTRALALVFLPAPPEQLERFLSRIPAPLFSALAAISVLDSKGGLAPLPVLGGLLGAVLLAPTRSMLKTLAGGLGGYAVVTWLIPWIFVH